MIAETAGARVFVSTANSEGVASSAKAVAFAYMVDTGIVARNARALAYARTARRGTCAILVAARACAPMAVTDTGAPNAEVRVSVSTAGERMLARTAAVDQFLPSVDRL